ncbi:hypothetical protein BGZ99_010016 [Dissophora globulifera]|uniref:Uncharacterized protein n=1 Tax=Dissophora globulifera TaxID=979702 RepID=A0A9P6RV03_9FUNG|nr:hypothetical protein BGZ99_010016 [Dissophora globulifera]
MARSPALLSVDRNLQTPSTVSSLLSLADDSEKPKPDETSASAEAQTVFKNKYMSKLEAKDKLNKLYLIQVCYATKGIKKVPIFFSHKKV